MKPELEIKMTFSGITELPLSIIHLQAHLSELDLSGMYNLVSLPSSIYKLKGLVKLHVRKCSKLESLPEEIGDLENLEELDASYTIISPPPSSIVRLNKLKVLDLSFCSDRPLRLVYFVFPHVNEGLRSLEHLDLSYCNLIDGGIAQLGELRSLDLSDCKRLTQLPEIPQQLDTINADWSNDSNCNSLFHNISLLQHDISVSLRVFTSWMWFVNIPSWFHHQGTGASVSVNLPEDWYVSDNFLGFAVCYSGKRIGITAHLILVCCDGMSSMTQKFALSNHPENGIHFLLVPLTGL